MKTQGGGTAVTYRCPLCKNCQACLNSNKVVAISLKEKVEQASLEKSVYYNFGPPDSPQGQQTCGPFNAASSKFLYNLLACGENQLKNLLKVLLAFRLQPLGLTEDVKQAYNQIHLRSPD